MRAARYVARMNNPEIATTIVELRARLSSWRGKAERIGLVPTMGALHDGHISLVDETRKRCARTVVSIFVNPAQFAPHEDFDRYPRDLKSDARKLTASGVDLIFAPSIVEMYPMGFATRIEVGGPSAGLETDFRPHFFAGVATVVGKLLIAAMPDYAIFGEKDYQQLLVIRRMVADLGLPIEIAGGAIIREADGLAMSSRNAYLTPEQRQVAGQLNRVLHDVKRKLRYSNNVRQAEEYARAELLKAGFDSVDYVAIRDATTLASIEFINGAARILAAVKIGGTRLIDNMAI